MSDPIADAAYASPAIEDARRTGAPGLVELYEEIADCPACGLARTRTQTVPGSGPAPAEVMCIGEAPGAREDEQGLPFVGAAGRFLDELLGDIGMSRETVHIANVVKCRPPGNRDPQPEEIAACQPFLDRQIALVDPLLIVTLGRFSMARWFSGTTISRIHGQPKRFGNRLVGRMFHPAAALRRGDLRTVIHADFARIPALIEEARAIRAEAPSDATDPALAATAVPPPSEQRALL